MIMENTTKIGRFFNSFVDPPLTRTGECQPEQCETLTGEKGAACCKLGYACNALDGIQCSEYNTRARNCRVFPHMPQDINLVKNCGY